MCYAIVGQKRNREGAKENNDFLEDNSDDDEWWSRMVAEALKRNREGAKRAKRVTWAAVLCEVTLIPSREAERAKAETERAKENEAMRAEAEADFLDVDDSDDDEWWSRMVAARR